VPGSGKLSPAPLSARRGFGIMSSTDMQDGAPTHGAEQRRDPVVRRIGAQDVVDAFGQGLRDFQRAPGYGLLFGAIYALGGIAIALFATVMHQAYLVYPLAAGFALIGPFVAVGLYEVSRRLEAGQRLSLSGVFGVIFAQGRRELGWMAFVTLFVFIIWMYQVRLLLALFLGFQTFTTLGEFLNVVITTPEGIMFLLIGNVVGAILALVLFSLTVISFPLLLDRDLDFITAMITSVRSVVTSPGPMIGWALAIVALMIAACLPAFLGLLLVLPVLGFSTWHLYRKVVEPLPA
jgi:uncharacterized membrane protein